MSDFCVGVVRSLYTYKNGGTIAFVDFTEMETIDNSAVTKYIYDKNKARINSMWNKQWVSVENFSPEIGDYVKIQERRRFSDNVDLNPIVWVF